MAASQPWKTYLNGFQFAQLLPAYTSGKFVELQ